MQSSSFKDSIGIIELKITLKPRPITCFFFKNSLKSSKYYNVFAFIVDNLDYKAYWVA